jgi:polar amino acid transport system substrate-binding protein/glutamate/aspartate transport system substrate-binding protein
MIQALGRTARAAMALGLMILTALIGAAAPTGARADVIDRIMTSGVIRMGYRLDAPPFSYRSEAGAPAGLAVALCAALVRNIAEATGRDDLTVTWEPVTAQTRFAAIQSARVDLHCGPTTQTIARRATLDFSISYFIAGAGVVFRKGGAETLSDLTNEPVGVLAGTTTEALAPDLLRRNGSSAPVVTFPSHVDGMAALQNGEIEAYIGDQSILHYQLGRMPPLAPLVVTPELFSFEPYALTMARGETRLRLLVDQGLSQIYRSGEIYDHIRGAMGRVNLTALTEAVYEVVAIPE